MKETVKMSRAVCQLEKMYNKINSDKFNGELPLPIITVQSKSGTYGHCSRAKIWRRKTDYTYELNISAECLSIEIEEVLDTMIHEMIHLYCREKGIKEVSRGGAYHNKTFKQLAEEKGLKCIYKDKYGWNTEGHDNDNLTEYALQNDWSEIVIGRADIMNIPTGNGTSLISMGTGTVISTPTSTSSTRKYQCPKCKNSCRATKDINIMCMDCNEQMIKVVK